MRANPELVARALARTIEAFQSAKGSGLIYGTVLKVTGNRCEVQPADSDAATLPSVLLWLDGSTDQRTPVVGASVLCLQYGPSDYVLLYSTAWQTISVDAQFVLNEGLNGGVPISTPISAADNALAAGLLALEGKLTAALAVIAAMPPLVAFAPSLAPFAAPVAVVAPTTPLQYENPQVKH